MVTTAVVPLSEFQRVRGSAIDKFDKLSLIADMCRLNALSAVKRAGSGHLGSSFSAMDIVVWLYYEEMDTQPEGLDDPNRNVYFSSKGHDVPALYSVLHSRGILHEEMLFKLRRLGGLDGHPDVAIPGIEANSGSLGMGISKGKGMAWAKRYQARAGRVFVMTGDGELQEGQNYEALQSAAQEKLNNLTVIVDHNKVQSDKAVHEIIDLGNLEKKLEAFGWLVRRCDGHSFQEIGAALAELRSAADRPQVLIADTIKGRGVSFMEHPYALSANSGLYPWHSGAPDDRAFLQAYDEIHGRVNARLAGLGLADLSIKDVQPESAVPGPAEGGSGPLGEPVTQAARVRVPSPVSSEYVAQAYGDALVDLAPHNPHLVVLDADLAADCRVRGFEKAYPERFLEIGIAEQDMVSTAGGLARMGLLPVVNSFASFLASRANEQIYNNASEGTKVIYACHYAGLIPAGPGKSHQSIRDISLLAAIPNVTILQPCNADETRMAVEYCVEEAEANCALRLIIGPSPRVIELPAGYRLAYGRGVILAEGEDALLIGYGPVMLHEALLASELLRPLGLRLCVVNMPWLNRIDSMWLSEMIASYSQIYVVEDHASVGGLGDLIRRSLAEVPGTDRVQLRVFGVDGFPACGRPGEVLAHHGLDGTSLAERILQAADQPNQGYPRESHSRSDSD